MVLPVFVRATGLLDPSAMFYMATKDASSHWVMWLNFNTGAGIVKAQLQGTDSDGFYLLT